MRIRRLQLTVAAHEDLGYQVLVNESIYEHGVLRSSELIWSSWGGREETLHRMSTFAETLVDKAEEDRVRMAKRRSENELLGRPEYS